MRASRATLLFSAMVAACSGEALPARTLPEATIEGARCKVAGGRANPLVTEWDASEKARLEASLAAGPIVVEYSGCALRVLAECRAQGGYRWRRTTLSTDVFEVTSADELYAKLPLGAVALEAELEKSARLAVRTVVAGQWELADEGLSGLAARPECQRATHVVAGVAVGAHELHAGSGARAAAAAGGVVGVAPSATATALRRAGSAEACGAASEAAPAPDCASPVQLFLRPLPGTEAPQGPPGTVHARFQSFDLERPGEVYSGDRRLCVAPCEAWVDPVWPLHYRVPGPAGTMRLEVPDLEPVAAGGAVDVRPTPSEGGKLALGITGTALGGLAMMAGAGLTFFGCAADRGGDGTCTGGVVTLAVSPLLIGGGIYLIVDSGTELVAVPREGGR